MAKAKKEKPKEYSEGVKKRMQNLVQYSGKKKKKEPLVVEPEMLKIDDMTIEVPVISELSVS